MNIIHPTDVTKDETCWLYAENNKYPPDQVDPEKIGKWMLFLKPSEVNNVWDKINEAVNEGHLWHAKVSTSEVSGPTKTHAIMIYTKDYTDLDDVIEVLDYLEVSGIKSSNSIIRYKTDQQTSAGIYSGGGQRASIYSSKTIHQLAHVLRGRKT